MSGNQPKRRCRRCKTTYIPGVNGMHGGLCDECANVQRAPNGYAWHSWEKSQTYQDVETGKETEVSRDEAFQR